MITIEIIWTDYLLDVLKSTGLQIAILFGPLLTISFLLHFVSAGLSHTGIRIFTRNGFIYIFKLIGTPVHELGHAVFALLFGHSVTGMKMFDPGGKDGSFGSVTHTFKKGNIYQEIGNFFIGIGPILMCVIALYLGVWLLFGINPKASNPGIFNPEKWINLIAIKQSISGVYASLANYMKFILNGPNSNWWKIALFFYLQFAIGSSITLSISDLKSALKGFLFFVIIHLLFNLSSLWTGNFMMVAVRQIHFWLTDFYLLMLLALVINIAFLLIFLPIAYLVDLIKGK